MMEKYGALRFDLNLSAEKDRAACGLPGRKPGMQ